MVRLQPPGRTVRRARRTGGLVLRGLVLLAAVALAWLWWRSGQTTKSRPPRTSQPDGILVIPNSGKSGKGAEPMVLVPVSARPTPAPVLISATPPASPPISSRTNTPPITAAPRPPFDERVLAAQVALSRRAISSGSLDGVMGAQTRAALRAFQQQEDLPATSALDDATRAKLEPDAALYTNYVITADDLASLLPLGKTWLEKSQQSRLAYESILELVAEKSHSNPKLVRWLNPQMDWDNVPAGASVKVVN